MRDEVGKFYLHSTMYLLNRSSRRSERNKRAVFTFHYVSIKSGKKTFMDFAAILFTFHYVSIKSRLYRP